MKTTRLQIQFDGSQYYGWQIQTESIATVQSEINKALSKIYQQDIKTMGSGRTDAKVHALKYFVVYRAPFEILDLAIVKGVNANLPLDIRVVACEIVKDDFHATRDALKREYRYLFTNNKEITAFQQNYITNISYELDYEKMKIACAEFVGLFDFASYQTTGSDVITTKRTIYECSLHTQKSTESILLPDHYFIKVVGSGFLKQMVRLMVGAIWSVGRGNLEILDIRVSLEVEIGKHIAAVAPAQGLYKYNVEYP